MASICSEHQGYDTDCPRCNSGVERHLSHGYDEKNPCPVCDKAFQKPQMTWACFNVEDHECPACTYDQGKKNG